MIKELLTTQKHSRKLAEKTERETVQAIMIATTLDVCILSVTQMKWGWWLFFFLFFATQAVEQHLTASKQLDVVLLLETL